MTLRKVGKYYWLDIRIKGKRIRRSLRTDNKLEALDKYKEKKDELLAEYNREKIKFSDFCKQYMEWAWSSKPASALREQQRLEKIKDFFSSLEIEYLDEITPYHIEQLKAKLKRKGLSKATINRYLQLLRGLFYKAIDWEVYNGQNPLKKVKFYKENSPVKGLTKKQLKKILQASREISQKPKSPLQKLFYDLVVLSLNTGLRKSEILNLKWKDIKEDEIIIEGKGNKIRSVPLNLRAKEIIDKQPNKNEYVFDIPNRHQHDLLRRTVNQIKKKTGIDFHFHLLRHYFTTSLLEKGVDFVTIGSLLGHSKITTSLIYSHTDKERKKRAVGLLIK